jgi:hypothetical protein
MRRLLFVLGTTLLLVAVAWPWLSRLPFGRLPGDILIDRPGLKIYFPWVTTLLVSLLASLLLRLLRR